MGVGGSEGSGGVERGRGLPSAGTSWQLALTISLSWALLGPGMKPHHLHNAHTHMTSISA